MGKETATTKKKKYVPKCPYTDYQIYELWWKFLKLSKNYREFCEIMRSVTNTNTETNDFYKQVDEGYKKRHPESKRFFNYKYYDDHLSNWKFMGDVHLNDFEKWWKNWEVPKKKSYSIINLRDPHIRKKLPRYQFALYRHNKREEMPPTPDEVTKYLTNSIDYIFVAIPLSDQLKMEEIRKIISKMRKTKKTHDSALNECRFRIPYGHIKYDELKKYHDVYHSINFDRLNNRKEAQRKTDILDNSVFSKHLNNAEAIKKNVEQGIFPGRKYWGKSFSKKD